MICWLDLLWRILLVLVEIEGRALVGLIALLGRNFGLLLSLAKPKILEKKNIWENDDVQVNEIVRIMN